MEFERVGNGGHWPTTEVGDQKTKVSSSCTAALDQASYGRPELGDQQPVDVRTR